MSARQTLLRPADAGSDNPAVRVNARPVTLALQGGGSLGAFSWGVLDRLLDEPAIRIGAVSGAGRVATEAACG